VRVFWVDLHKWGGLALGIGVLIHVLLHWKWMVRMTRRLLGLGSHEEREPRSRAERTAEALGD
jgi:hypothetical protein